MVMMVYKAMFMHYILLCNSLSPFNVEGIRGSGKSIVTKHDLELSGRKNAINAMDKFSFSLETGTV